MDEHEPADDGEFVYRRIHRSYYRADLPIAIQREAFRPSESDRTGLSVVRARFAQPTDLFAHIDPAKAREYGVARLRVRDLRVLGLTVVPEPSPAGPPGHAVIPELSWQAYQAGKERLKEIQRELAKLAAIVLRPS
jgi:hypothetical protein